MKELFILLLILQAQSWHEGYEPCLFPEAKGETAEEDGGPSVLHEDTESGQIDFIVSCVYCIVV